MTKLSLTVSLISIVAVYLICYVSSLKTLQYCHLLCLIHKILVGVISLLCLVTLMSTGYVISLQLFMILLFMCSVGRFSIPGRIRLFSSSSGFRFDFRTNNWEPICPMISPRGSFACAVVTNVPNSSRIIAAGGGSRHTKFAAAGSRMSAVEMYDVGTNEWVSLDGLPRFRAGCVGFMVGNEEFWVMGGYGESRTVSGVPVDEYYSDAVVMELKNGAIGKWRQLGDMWEEGERRKLGRIAVIEDVNGGFPGVFMLDKSDIFRYDRASNRWKKVTSIPKKLTNESAVGFVALNGELHVMGYESDSDSDATEIQKSRQHKRSASLFLQIYHPQSMIWRTLITKPPFWQPLDFKTAVMCTIRL